MSMERNKEIIRHTFAEAVSQGNLELIDKYFDWHPVQIKKNLAEVRTVFPDLNVTVEDIFAEDNKVATRETWRGTDVASGDKVEGTVLHIFWMENGKVVDEWSAGWEWRLPYIDLSVSDSD